MKNLRILVAEDNGTFRKLLGAMIERITGSFPMVAEDGQVAYELVDQNQVDLVFMDNHMPILSGVEATREIRTNLPIRKQPYIVGISGSSDSQDIKELEECGMDALLAKPFHMDELAEYISEVYESKARKCA